MVHPALLGEPLLGPIDPTRRGDRQSQPSAESRIADQSLQDQSGRKSERAGQCSTSEAGVALLAPNVGSVEEGPSKPTVGFSPPALSFRIVRFEPPRDLVEESNCLVEVGNPVGEAVGFARRVPADCDGGIGSPGDRTDPRNSEPVVPIDDVAVSRVETAHLGVSRRADRHAGASERVADGEDREGGSGGEVEVRFSQPTPVDHRFGQRVSLVVDDLGVRSDPANRRVGLIGLEMRSEVSRKKEIILVKDRDEGRSTQCDAAVPVSTQTEPLGIDLVSSLIAEQVSGDCKGVVVGSIVDDQEVMRCSRLEDARQGRLQVPRAVPGGDGDGDQGARVFGSRQQEALSLRR